MAWQIDWKKVFDEYDLKARVLPAFIVTAPVIGAVFACVPGARSAWGILAGVLEVPLVYLLAAIARAKGRALQQELYRSWGGIPTTAMLRHADPRIDAVTKDRYKAVITRLTGVALPDAATEATNPAGADSAYGSAIKRFIELRRRKEDRLIFNENCLFGFTRNLLGLKRLGLTLAVACLAIEIVVAMLLPQRFAAGGEIAMLISLGVLLLLAFYVTPRTVRLHAEAYAEALLRSAELDAAIGARARPIRKPPTPNASADK